MKEFFSQDGVRFTDHKGKEQRGNVRDPCNANTAEKFVP